MRKDYVDSCVFLGMILDKNQDCKNYINTLGYQKNLQRMPYLNPDGGGLNGHSLKNANFWDI